MHATILDTIGSPLVRVESPPGVTVAAKVESKNPGGSAKDRPALAMVEAAERDGQISPGDDLVEPTSGNTGIGLAVVAAAKGYDLTVVMPESQSPERREVMRAYGADIELVSGDISDAKDRADEIEREDGAIQLRQFENPENPRAHYLTTGPEIIEQIGDRSVDALVAGVGTGGTITGIGRRLREEFPEMEVVAVEPANSPVLSGGDPAGHDFQGMGPGFVSPNLDTDLLDDVETVTINEAEAECRRLAREEGILVGQSSGASNLAAKRVAERLADPDAVHERSDSDGYVLPDEPGGTVGSDPGTEDDDLPLVITVYWDGGERYMSTGMFE